MATQKVSIHYYTDDSTTVEDVWATAARFSVKTIESTDHPAISGDTEVTEVVVNRAMSTYTSEDGVEGPRYSVDPKKPQEGIWIYHGNKDAYAYSDTVATIFNQYFKVEDNSALLKMEDCGRITP